MAAVAHSPAFSKRVGVSQKVGRDFNEADAGTGILSGKSRRGRVPGFKGRKTRSYTAP